VTFIEFHNRRVTSAAVSAYLSCTLSYKLKLSFKTWVGTRSLSFGRAMAEGGKAEAFKLAMCLPGHLVGLYGFDQFGLRPTEPETTRCIVPLTTKPTSIPWTQLAVC